MTDRDYIRQQLSAYLDGELDTRDAAQVEQALAADAELAAELAQLRATREKLRRLPIEHAPEDFASRLMDQVERRHLVHLHAPGKLDINWVRYAVTAAVALIALSVGVMTAITIYSASKSQDNAMAGGQPPSPTQRPGVTVAMVDKVNKEGLAKDICTELEQTDDLNCIIATDSLPRTQRELEHELKSNAIQPIRQAHRGDEEIVYEGEVDHTQVAQLKQVVSNIRGNNLGADISFRNRAEEKQLSEQAECAKKAKDVEGSKLAYDETNRDNNQTKGGGLHKGDACSEVSRAKPTAPGGAGSPPEDGNRRASEKPGDKAAQAPATAPASRSSEHGTDIAKTQTPGPAPGKLPASQPADQINGGQVANGGWQSNAAAASNRNAQRFSIRLQYHPSITQSRDAQNQSGANGQAGSMPNAASQSELRNQESQPATDTNGLNR